MAFRILNESKWIFSIFFLSPSKSKEEEKEEHGSKKGSRKKSITDSIN
ncbi:hypothetical protein [Methanosarcina siciliae]|nr:hypothetical protein [Methanosarcina siciliae]